MTQRRRTNGRLCALIVPASVLLAVCSGSAESAQQPVTSSPVVTSPDPLSSVPTPVEPVVVERIETTWEEEITASPFPPAGDDDLFVIADQSARDQPIELWAFDGAGEPQWTVDFALDGEPLRVKARSYITHMLVTDRAVVVTGVRGRLPREEAVLVALDRDTGDLLWTVARGEARYIDAPNRQLLDTDGDTVYWLTGDGIEAIDIADGSTRWTRAPDDTQRELLSVWLAGDVIVALTDARQSRTTVFDPSTGEPMWSIPDNIAVVDVSGNAEVIVAITDNPNIEFRSLDPQTGEARWSHEATEINRYLLDSMILSEDLLIATAGATILVYRLDGSPELLWRAHTEGASLGGFTTRPVVVDGTVSVGGYVSRFGGNPQGGFVDTYQLDTGVLVRQSFVDGSPTALIPTGAGELATTVSRRNFVPARVMSVRLVEPVGRVAVVSDPPESVLLGIPSPGDALTVKNAALAALVLSVLTLLVALPTTLFNSALERALELRMRPRWWPTRGPRSGRGSGVRLWQRPSGVAIYAAASAVLYSRLQNHWGLNSATVIAAIAFFISIIVTTGAVFIGARLAVSRQGRDTGHPDVDFPTLGIAAICVLTSRAIGFAPGFFYGVVARYDVGVEESDDDEGDIALVASALILLASVVAWLLLAPLKHLADHGPIVLDLLPATAAGVFMAGIESLTIGLLPIRLLPGAALRRRHRHVWKFLWASGGFLFALVLLQPGLVQAETSSVWWTMAIAALFGAIAIGFWATVRRADSSRVGTTRHGNDQASGQNVESLQLAPVGDHPSAASPAGLLEPPAAATGELTARSLSRAVEADITAPTEDRR